MEPLIKVRDLYKIFNIGSNKVYALNGVSFDIYKGEFIAIVGTSGSGKSTCLNMLAGLEAPSKGVIQIANKRIDRMNEAQLVKFRRQNVGFIFQSYNLIPSMNAIENVAMPLMFRGVNYEKRMKTAKHYMELIGIGDQGMHMPNQMSGGQQQRVGIARALVIDPQIIFADEPTGNLDSHTTDDVLDLMKKIVSEEHRTMVMVTHDPHIASWADRQLKVVDGHIVETVINEQSPIEIKIKEENGEPPFCIVTPKSSV
ncbi:MAG: ABC transporter ATP-binding protein [Lachnospiraceae bacterium]|nr:ABC transporter ATP-binding protein [Lachnospiraceae bacterium]